jgi:hypothetical protein
MRCISSFFGSKAINNRSQVVGGATLFENGRAYDLNALLDTADPLQPYVRLFDAVDINDRGFIAAAGVDSRTGATHAYVLKALIPPYSLVPSSLPFGNQPLNVASVAKKITVTNTGVTSLPIIEIRLIGTKAGQFSLTHACGLSVPSGAGCTVTVRFKPTVVGSVAAKVRVGVGEPAFARTVSVSGTGVKSSFSLSTTSLSFGSVTRGTTSAAKTVKVSNTGTVALPIASIAVGGTNPGQFSQTNNCPAQVAVGGSCRVSVVFKPTSRGNKSATLVVTPGGGASRKSVALTGTGI